MTEKELIESGNMKMDWARNHMPVLAIVREKFEEEKPLKGLKVGMALHVEAKTAVLVETLAAGGAEVSITGCNPLSTQDDVSLALDTRKNISCFARYGVESQEYYEAIDRVLDIKPDITIDDGADLIFKLHTERTDLLPNILGGCEETTTGVHRLHAMEKEGALKMPVIAVNDAMTKYLFDNRYGTGQSAWDGLTRPTSLLVAGKNVVVAGYGWCGRGVAMRASGLGANVIVTEVDPIRALEAKMDGYRVMKMADAAKLGELFVTTTGNRDILTAEHFKSMPDGAILANSGHFNVEIDMEALASLAKSTRTVRHNIKEYDLGDRRINVIAEGRLVNLAAGDGHPAEVMDMSFANQALCVRYIAENKLSNGVHKVPLELDTFVAKMKLKSMGITIDELTPTQECYMSGWECGT
ncbi:adenosylhomocysteinase [Methanosarcina spelaei]|uniref:S-inosyl-L-homocysteine hydrolase n=1 Tax=Methanosarcina spelaei TaxID=1036679 RepID=A0A2A2HU18_9EURY|nr:adenosylhomocysteinase [Methanosarcina spelaei]PAV12805.1 adenosylhomocysteinase [Methanosarcina spelaei]